MEGIEKDLMLNIIEVANIIFLIRVYFFNAEVKSA